MKSLARVMKPLQSAARAFFSHDVAIRRDEDGVRLVLEEALPPGVPRPPTAKELARRKEQAELTQVLDDLREVLDEATGARTTLHHLVFVEHALSKKGLRTLHKLPLPVLQRALDQLEHLVTNWSQEGLANLRSKMAVAVIDREHMDPEAEADAYRTSAVLDLPLPAVHELPAAAAAAVLARHAVDIPIDELQPPAAEPPKPLPRSDATQEDVDALAAAYAAIGASTTLDAMDLAPLEYQEELGSAAARNKPRSGFRDTGAMPELQLRELQD
jgi:hypothetical protein